MADVVRLAILAHAQAVLLLVFGELTTGVNKEHVVGADALLEHQNADGDAGREEELRGEADHGVDVAVVDQLTADALLYAAAEKYTVREDDGHRAVLLEVVEAVEQEGHVGRLLGREAIVTESGIVGQLFAGGPFEAEGGQRWRQTRFFSDRWG